MKLRVIFLFLIALCSSTSIYSSGTPDFIKGVGAASCSDWLERRAENSDYIDNILGTWLQGYISGINIQKARVDANYLGVVEVPQVSMMISYLDRECAANPSEYIFIIASQLYAEAEFR